MTLIAVGQKITAMGACVLRNLAERTMLCKVLVFCSKKRDMAEPLASKHLQRISNSARGSVELFTLRVIRYYYNGNGKRRVQTFRWRWRRLNAAQRR
jgi:hypothetical protein